MAGRISHPGAGDKMADRDVSDANSTPTRSRIGPPNHPMREALFPVNRSVHRGLRSFVPERRGARMSLGSQCSTD